MLKEQLFLFFRVALNFGHIFWGINILMMTEILENAMSKIAEFTPVEFQNQMFKEMGYVPGSDIETWFRLWGVTIIVLAVINSMKMSKNLKQPKMWLPSLWALLLIDILFYITVLWQGIQVNVLHNGPIFIALIIGTLIWVYRRRKKWDINYRSALYQLMNDQGEWIRFKLDEHLDLDRYKNPSALIEAPTDELKDNYGSAVIFADNPRSEILNEETNKLRRIDLKIFLDEQSYLSIEARGGDPRNESSDSEWPWEAGYFIQNISYEDAVKLGRKFEQNAILYQKENEFMKLVWCL